MGECVKVIVRCRPMNSLEREQQSQKVVRIHPDLLQVVLVRPQGEAAGETPKAFTFDAVFDDDSRQDDVYNQTARPLVQSVMEGYNATIFAYGQTGCGKTFTMEGVRTDPDMRGLIPRSFDHIFEMIGSNGNSAAQFLVQAAYVEIYNEEIRDLTSDDPKARLELKEDPNLGVYIKGLKQTVVSTAAQINKVMDEGNSNRTVGATRMNATSSRSHSIFMVRVETSEPDETPGSNPGDVKIRAGKLNLVDLAGSERQSKTQATGQRLKEANKINLSLSALGNVISALVAGKDRHIPYRDSKLTRLLQDSLGGNTKTCMCAAVSPADYNYEETLSTLRYANRAKNIKNKPKINEDPKDALLREYQDEIKRLKALLEAQGVDISKIDFKSLPAPPPAAGGAAQPKRASVGGAPGGPSAGPGKEDGGAGEYDDDEKKDPAAIEDEVGEDPSEASPEQLRQWQEAKEELERETVRLSEEKTRHERMAAQLAEQIERERQERERAEEERQRLANQLQENSDAVEAERRAKAELADELARRMEEEKQRHQELAAQLEARMQVDKEKEDTIARQMSAVKEEASLAQDALKRKLAKLQKKLLAGTETVDQVKGELESKMKEAQDELEKERQKQKEIAEEKQRLEDEKLLVEENYASVKDEVSGKTRKLKRLTHKYKAAMEEIKDLQGEFETEKEGYLSNIRDLYRELRLYKRICEEFLTQADIDKIVRGSSYDENKEVWKLPKIEMPVVFPKIAGSLSEGMMMGLDGRPISQREMNNGSAAGMRGRVGRPGKPGRTGPVEMSGDPHAADAGWKRSVTAMAMQEGSDQFLDSMYKPRERSLSRSRPPASGGRDPPRPSTTQQKAQQNVRLSHMDPQPPPQPRSQRSGSMVSTGTVPKERPSFEPPFKIQQPLAAGIESMDLPKPRASFEPDRAFLGGNGNTGASPRGLAPNVPDIPRKPSFQPDRPASSSGRELGNPLPDSVATVRPRASFQPAAMVQVQEEADPLAATAMLTRPRPAFAPAVPMQHREEHSALPASANMVSSRPAFNPGPMMHKNDAFDPPLNFVNVTRPNFQPAVMGK